ncbi:short-subunit dehydrogenase [Pedobacter psychrotolerans]|uniref:Short-chain dehydrogenase n=1 Tax=Pedobacter psychrotolerans TaxID=1843235 RepID=A0A4R2HMN9_9SPHI|nr:SDR family oxidoreductase [Pedobacter psychrotolerans]TCO31233.1 short-subunit dehydrogenase [Pedobacter psychrotolerans]GGE41218.1 short-chain dehydrogenase [Pedobacter psychrotolerans]
MEIKKRTIVITGASSGAGRAIALEFARKEERLILASRNLNILKEVAEECEAFGAEVKCLEVDVSDYHAILNLAAAADEFGSGIDVWVNNAGVLAVGAFDETPMEVSEQVLKTNLLGYMHGAHAVLPYFKKQGRGILINNISIGGFLAVPMGAAYSASKFGLRGFGQALKAELSAYPNIHVCDAFPAFLDSPGIQHAANYTGKYLKPAPPVYDPERLAQAIVSLADHPRREKMVGSVSVLLRLSAGLFPTLTQMIAGIVIKGYLKRADPIPTTNGNIFTPVPYGNAVHGGWGIPGKPKAHRKYIAGIAASLALIALVKIAGK